MIWLAIGPVIEAQRRPAQRRGMNRPRAGAQLPGPNRRNPNRPGGALGNQALMRELGLTPEQRQRMNRVGVRHEDELVIVGRRVRQARQALDLAILDERYDEALIKRRIDDMASAVADRARLQAQMRAEVRSVLTPLQVVRLKELQRQQRQQRREIDRQRQLDGAARTNKSSEEDRFDVVSLLLLEP